MTKTVKMTPSQLYHAGKITRQEYEAMIGQKTGHSNTCKSDVKRVLGRKFK